MKRIERNTYNSLRKSITANTINVEIPVEYTHEGRQGIHEMLTIEKHMRASMICWNSIINGYVIHYVPTVDEYTEAQRMEQEAQDIDEVMHTLPKSDRTWSGYEKPTEEQTTENEEEEEEETMTTANELQKYVDSIAAELRKMYEADLTDEEREAAEENGEAYDLYTYFADALDIEYTINSRGDFLGARIAVTLGGPNIYIYTREGEVKGYWGTDRATKWIPSEICEEINGIMEEYYDMVRGA